MNMDVPITLRVSTFSSFWVYPQIPRRGIARSVACILMDKKFTRQTSQEGSATQGEEWVPRLGNERG